MKMPKSKRRRSEATRVDEQQSAPAPSSEASPAGVAPKSSRRKKRKRSSAAGEKQTAGGGRLPLAGLILAVSVDHKQGGEGTGDEAPSRGSYKFICDRCRALGAQITSQVHRRVHAVIASPEAVRNATQRVRKAIKKGVAVVDSGWVFACLDAGERVGWEAFDRKGDAREAIIAKESSKKEAVAAVTGESDNDANAVSGWTDPVELDCCCVCHENGDQVCPWCTGDSLCNVNRRAMA